MNLFDSIQFQLSTNPVIPPNDVDSLADEFVESLSNMKVYLDPYKVHTEKRLLLLQINSNHYKANLRLQSNPKLYDIDIFKLKLHEYDFYVNLVAGLQYNRN